MALLTVHLANPAGYGRIMRDSSGTVVGIVEQKDATAEQLLVNEANKPSPCLAFAVPIITG